MTNPDTETMQTLVVLIDCRCVAAMESGELHAVMDAGGMHHVTLEDRCISELVAREWLEVREEAGGLLVGVTPAGNYHGEKWLRRYERDRKRAARAKA